MAKLLKLRRGTTTQHGSFTGAEGEVTVDTDKETLVVHDGSTAGGHPVAAEDMANVSSASIAGRLANDSIATSKLAAGALPSDVTVASANLVDGTIATADIAADAVTNAKIADDSIDSEHYVDGSIDHAHLSNDCIDGDNIQNDVINSEHYVAGSIDHEHLANDIIDGDNIQDDVINSEHYVAGSIDHEHLANDAVDGDNIADDSINSEHYVDGSIDTAHIADDQVTYAKIQNVSATDRLLGRDSSGAGIIEEIAPSAIRTMINVENGATADQTGAEILALINSSDIYTSSKIGRDAGDYITFTTDTRMDVYVNGNNEFRFEADGDFHADGDVIAQSTTISSDAKLKEDIQVVPNALDKLDKLNGVTFTWKRSKEKSAGVIAQDVQEVLPEAVKEVTALSNGETHLSVNYHALTSILIEAVKELQAEVEKLKGGK